MNYATNESENRTGWEFEYTAGVLADAAKSKKNYRQSRADWWAGVRITVEAVRPACGCAEGTCESKPNRECRMALEVRANSGAQ